MVISLPQVARDGERGAHSTQLNIIRVTSWYVKSSHSLHAIVVGKTYRTYDTREKKGVCSATGTLHFADSSPMELPHASAFGCFFFTKWHMFALYACHRVLESGSA